MHNTSSSAAHLWVAWICGGTNNRSEIALASGFDTRVSSAQVVVIADHLVVLALSGIFIACHGVAKSGICARNDVMRAIAVRTSINRAFVSVIAVLFSCCASRTGIARGWVAQVRSIANNFGVLARIGVVGVAHASVVCTSITIRT